MYNAGNFNAVSWKTIAVPSIKDSLSYDKSNSPKPTPTAPVENAKTKATVKKLVDRHSNNRNWDAKVAIVPYGSTDLAMAGNIKYANDSKHSLLKNR